jgi:uncharacterized protein YbaP (TraB family)
MTNFRSLSTLIILVALSFSSLSQKKYQSLLWEVTGPGMEKPCYLYGTMHVSGKVVFQLGDPFYDAIQSVDIVALELEPEAWLQSMFDRNGFGRYSDYSGEYDGEMGYYGNTGANPLLNYFKLDQKIQENVMGVLAYEPPLLNYMLTRFDEYGESAEFEENTWLDMYIYQTGKKMGKKTIGLETYQQTTDYGKLARKEERNEKINKSYDSEDRKDLRELQGQIEPAYRRQDLDLVDSISWAFNSPAFNKYILVERNKVFVHTIDSVIKAGQTIFAGMGCAHIPGKQGVVEMLRNMGYTVEPIDKGTRDAKRRAKLDKVVYKRTYSDFTSKDEVLKFKTPTTVYPLSTNLDDQAWLAMDIPNGANFMVYRMKTYSGFTKKSQDFILSSIDSILYEAVPGDIISSKKIAVQGFPAFDILSKTRRGDFQRRRVIVAPEEIFILKLTASNDKVSKGYGDEFFDSFTINYDKKISAMHNFVSRDKSLQLTVPGDLTTYISEDKYDKMSNLEITSYDKTTDAYYVGYRYTVSEPSFLDEDSYLAETIEEAYMEDFKLEKIHSYPVRIDGYESIIGKYKSKQDEISYGLFIPQNLNRYAFFVNTKDSTLAYKYFESINIDQSQYAKFYNYNDTLLHFKIDIPFDLNDEQKDSDYGFNWDSDDDINEAEDVSERIRIFPPFAPESILVRMKRYNKFYQLKDSTTFFERVRDDFSEYGDMKLVEGEVINTPTGFKREYIATDTASTRALHYLVQIHNNTYYELSTSVDTLLGKSEFIKKGFGSFVPTDTIFARSVFDNGGKYFLDDVASTDSTTQKNALLMMNDIWLSKENAPAIRQMLKNLPRTEEEKDKDELKLILLEELWRDSSKSNLDFLTTEYYANSDSANIQNLVLKNLGWMDTKESTVLFKKLIMDEPPIGPKGSYMNPLSSMRDSLELATTLFPEAISLVSLEEMKPATYSLLALLVDSGFVKKNVYEKQYDLILLETKNELKRVNASDEKGYSFSTTSLMNFCRLLMPYKDKPDVKAIFDKIYKSKKRALLTDYVQFNLQHDIVVPDSTIKFISEDKESVIKLVKMLQEEEKQNLIPTRLTRDSLITLYCEKKFESKYDNKGKVDTVDVIMVKKVTIKGKPYEVCYVTYKRKREPDPRGTVFVFPDNGQLWPDFFWESSNTMVLEHDEDPIEELDKLYKEVVRSHRKDKYGANSYDFGSFGGWTFE